MLLIDEASQTIDKEQREALTTECAALLNEIVLPGAAVPDPVLCGRSTPICRG